VARCAVECVGEGFGRAAQVVVVAGAVGEVDVEVAGGLGEGEVAGAVEREGEDAGVVGEDRRGAVALVDVAVDDHDPAARPSDCMTRAATAASLKTQ
jgi:hypothetical protein